MSIKDRLQQVANADELDQVMSDLLEWGSANWTYSAAARFVPEAFHEELKSFFGPDGALRRLASTAAVAPEDAQEEPAGLWPDPVGGGKAFMRGRSLAERISVFHRQLEEARVEAKAGLYVREETTGTDGGGGSQQVIDEADPRSAKDTAHVVDEISREPLHLQTAEIESATEVVTSRSTAIEVETGANIARESDRSASITSDQLDIEPVCPICLRPFEGEKTTFRGHEMCRRCKESLK